MWLLAGQKAPDHSTIARFRTGFLADACEALFYQYVRKLADMGELSKETVFIDGTKLEACANKYTFVWKKFVGEWKEKMLAKIVDFMDTYCKENHVRFVYGRGNRKTIHQKYYEVFRRFLDRQLLYDLHNSRFGNRNSYSKTDVDATFTHMKDDHMRNAQLKPGYNVQIGVDSEYIVAADIFQDRNDVWTLVPFLKTMEKNLGFRYPSITADSGYESEEGYEYLKNQSQTPYIKPQTYEKWKKRSFKKDISKRENMEYDPEEDTYTCHAIKKLSVLFKKKQKSKSGYISDVTVYEGESCRGCIYKDKCSRSKGNKRLYVSKNFIEKR